jgi:uncharacterized protein (TIGR02466 family)
MESFVYLFQPYPIFWSPVDSTFNQELFTKICYNIKKEQGEGRNISNCKGWQSKIIPFNEDKIKPISNYVLAKLLNIFEFSIFTNLRICIDHIWINISPPNSYNSTHIHLDGEFAGVCYISGEGSDLGDIVFHGNPFRDNEVEFYKEEEKEKLGLWGSYSYPPYPGSLIVFPSTLPHEVKINLSSSDRISVAFNIKVFK